MTPPKPPHRPSSTGEHIRVVETGDIPVMRDVPEPDTFKPATRDDVTDHAMLPRHVRMIASELQALTEHVAAFEHRLRRVDDRLSEIERFSTGASASLHDRIDEVGRSVNDKLDQIMLALGGAR